MLWGMRVSAGGTPPSHVETFSRTRTPLGIVAAVCNRGICPHVTFLPRLQATLLVGEEHHMNRGNRGDPSRCYGIPIPLSFMRMGDEVPQSPILYTTFAHTV